jgi:[ribosomal protein S18]-alanine N-acetyltransferase
LTTDALLNSVEIRPATAGDIPSMMSLDRQCPSAAHWTEHQYQRLFLADEAGPQRLVLVAEENVPSSPVSREDHESGLAIQGFLVARHLAPEWELENIVVAPNARRKGLGKRLLDKLLARAKETQSKTVFLEVRESNAEARKLYEKAGFEQTGRRKSYYSNPTEDAVLYRHTLD